VITVDLQHQFPRRDVVRILQREKQTLLTVIHLAAIGCGSFPFHGSEHAENIPFCVENHVQSVCVTVTSTMKFFHFETIAIGWPQKQQSLLF
jgi:phosphoenolpyruvate carboxylase